MRYIITIYLLIVCVNAFADEPIGKVINIIPDKYEIHVSNPAKSTYGIGEKLFIYNGDSSIPIIVAFPMMTAAKCHLKDKKMTIMKSIHEGDPVYYKAPSPPIRKYTFNSFFDSLKKCNVDAMMSFIEDDIGYVTNRTSSTYTKIVLNNANDKIKIRRIFDYCCEIMETQEPLNEVAFKKIHDLNNLNEDDSIQLFHSISMVKEIRQNINMSKLKCVYLRMRYIHMSFILLEEDNKATLITISDFYNGP